jgi:hypothetical protein
MSATMFYDPQQPATKETATVVAAVIGLVGALAGVAVSWFNSTSATAQRMRVYQEATGRVSFWDDWLKARLAAGTSPEETARLQARVQNELCVAVEYVEGVVRGEKARAAYHVMRQNLVNVRRWFLLYKPSRGRAWMARIMFFLLLAAALVYFVTFYVDRDLTSLWTVPGALSPYVISPTLIVFAWLSRGISILLEKPTWDDRADRYAAIDKLRAT